MDSIFNSRSELRSDDIQSFWAHLANTADVEDLTSGEQARILGLLTIWCETLLELYNLGGSARSTLLSSMTPGSKSGRAVLRKTHRISQDVIVKLLDGESVRTDTLNLTSVSTTWNLSGPEGTLEERFAPNGKVDLQSFLLFMAIKKSGPFPFRRCKQCRRVFARNRRQEFCSGQCRTQSAESRRKATPARKEQLAKAAKKHRAKIEKARKSRKKP